MYNFDTLMASMKAETVVDTYPRQDIRHLLRNPFTSLMVVSFPIPNLLRMGEKKPTPTCKFCGIDLEPQDTGYCSSLCREEYETTLP
jgi:hypothetical protein